MRIAPTFSPEKMNLSSESKHEERNERYRMISAPIKVIAGRGLWMDESVVDANWLG